MKSKEKKEQKLQEMLVAARNELEAAEKFALKNGLTFSFSGVRVGPVDTDDYGGYHIGLDENDRRREAGEKPLPVKSDSLDFSSEWMGSWSPGCG